ncbi:hypothetical protein GOBAR_AA11009 [Gossypium barbadense]|uniref:Importin subunit alpha n=1 Tax=Gossypium barbadense TaxID=3634 RepID=A0A2P5Y256_GOSBA|nr:hypothetical protein GOBAR_AA11009 [Gossypium barbadense]
MYEVTEELKGEIYCTGSRLVLNGSTYFCKTCPGFYLHEKCAKSPYEIRHPFHSSHPLNHYTSYYLSGQLITCDECRDICHGFIYFCEQCNFKLDMKCAALTTHKIRVLEEKKMDRVTELHHFTHPISLSLPIVEDNIEIRKNNFKERLRKKLKILAASVWSDNNSLQPQAITRFTKLLSKKYKAPIEEVIQAGVVPRFVELLGSPSDGVREQAVLALRNIVGDSPRCRDIVLGHGALLPLLAQLNQHAELYMLRNATWILATFCKPSFDQVKLVLPTLARLIHSNDDEVVLTNACWAQMTKSKLLLKQVYVGVWWNFWHPYPSVITSALYTVGHIVSGDDVQTQCVISHQALLCLLNLLTNNYEKSIKELACWAISNITAGNEEQIQAVFEANIITSLVQLLQNAEFYIKKHATCAISNATFRGTHDQIGQGCIKPLCDLLNCPDPEVVTICLQGLENILKVGEADKNMGSIGEVNLYAQMIDDVEGREKIENLQSHDNIEIYEKAVEVFKT